MIERISIPVSDTTLYDLRVRCANLGMKVTERARQLFMADIAGRIPNDLPAEWALPPKRDEAEAEPTVLSGAEY